MIDDAKITSRARKIIVANWFDVSQLRVRSTRGVIHIQGRMRRLTPTPTDADGSEPMLRKLDQELRASPGCRGAKYDLENWIYQASGTWHLRTRKKPETARGPSSASSQQAMDISDTGGRP